MHENFSIFTLYIHIRNKSPGFNRAQRVMFLITSAHITATHLGRAKHVFKFTDHLKRDYDAAHSLTNSITKTQDGNQKPSGDYEAN